jgi:hypothetical protein
MTMEYPISGYPEFMYQEINEGVNRHLNSKHHNSVFTRSPTLNLLRVVTRSPTRASNISLVTPLPA